MLFLPPFLLFLLLPLPIHSRRPLHPHYRLCFQGSRVQGLKYWEISFEPFILLPVGYSTVWWWHCRGREEGW